MPSPQWRQLIRRLHQQAPPLAMLAENCTVCKLLKTHLEFECERVNGFSTEPLHLAGVNCTVDSTSDCGIMEAEMPIEYTRCSRAAIYGRVSTSSQTVENQSTELGLSVKPTPAWRPCQPLCQARPHLID
jgi:hypothetical protein